jgi:hypothetical protein
VIELHDDWVHAQFWKNDTILGASDAPHCIAWWRSTAKLPSSAGTLIAGGDMVGQPNGPSAPIKVELNKELGYEYNAYLRRPPFLFLQGTTQTLNVETKGTSTFPAFPRTTFHTGGFHILKIITPTLSPQNTLTISSKKDMPVKWVVPSDPGSARVGVSLFFLFGFDTGGVGEVRCGAPVSAGKMIFPASLLSEMRKRLSPNAPIEGAQFRISVGDQMIRNINGASYFIEVSPTTVDDKSYGTTFGELLGATLD